MKINNNKICSIDLPCCPKCESPYVRVRESGSFCSGCSNEFENKDLVPVPHVAAKDIVGILRTILPHYVEMNKNWHVIMDVYELWYDLGGRCKCAECQELYRKKEDLDKFKEDLEKANPEGDF